MKKVQKGFTLIELMIVIAIIGILAAVAIPAYQDYVVRTRVSEGVNLAAGAKTGVSEFVLTNAEFPQNNTSAGVSAPTDITGNNVQSIDVTGSTITITYTGDDNIAGDTITLTAATTAGSVQWTCAAGTIDAQYLPASCR